MAASCKFFQALSSHLWWLVQFMRRSSPIAVARQPAQSLPASRPEESRPAWAPRGPPPGSSPLGRGLLDIQVWPLTVGGLAAVSTNLRSLMAWAAALCLGACWTLGVTLVMLLRFPVSDQSSPPACTVWTAPPCDRLRWFWKAERDQACNSVLHSA